MENLPDKGKQGVYRSSYKNALRLARTENNMAYHSADYERWQQLDFVVGIEVMLSNNHTLNGVPFTDICNDLQGKYPKNFKFTGWHPACRCFAVSILKTDEEMNADSERIMNGEELSENSVNTVKDLPVGFKKWVNDNADRIERAEKKGTLPYFLKDNDSIVKSIDTRTAQVIFSEKKYSEEFLDYINHESREDIPRRGLVNSGDFSWYGDKITNYDLDILFELYFENYKNDVNGKFGGVGNVTGGSMMECVRDMKRRINYLKINDQNKRIGQGLTYNAGAELKSAITNIRAGKTLTFKEEYAVENVWHEFLHGKSVGFGMKLTASQEASMEAINQLVARNSYNDFLVKLGGKAMHKKQIIQNGFGYNTQINNLRAVLKKYGVNEDLLLSNFKSKILTEKYTDIEDLLTKFLSEYHIKDIKKILENLALNENSFSFLFKLD
jgi:hypothetical protein